MRLFGEVNDVFPTRTGRRFRRARASLRATVEQLIARRRGAGDQGDFVSLLIAARDERGAFSDAQARDEALTILLAGHETTANALTWTFDLLGRHPDAARRMDEELASTSGARRRSSRTSRACRCYAARISEALRLFPPAWLTGRSALGAVRIGACELRRGDVALAEPVRHPSQSASVERAGALPARALGRRSRDPNVSHSFRSAAVRGRASASRLRGSKRRSFSRRCCSASFRTGRPRAGSARAARDAASGSRRFTCASRCAKSEPIVR